jgi:hypothetical protein
MQGLIPDYHGRSSGLRRMLFLLTLILMMGAIPALAADTPVSPFADSVASPLHAVNGKITVSNHVPQNFTFVGIIHLIRVEDADLNITPGGGNDTVTVAVQQVGNPGSLQNVILSELVDTPGVFTGLIDNSTVVSTPNVSLSFTYLDAATVQGVPIPRVVVLNVIATPSQWWKTPTKT